MKSILLIGLGRFGKHIALHLNHLGHQVMAVDTSEERVEAVLPIVTNAQIGDSTDAEFLESLGPADAENFLAILYRAIEKRKQEPVDR